MPDQCNSDYHLHSNSGHSYGHHHHHLNSSAVTAVAFGNTKSCVAASSCGNGPSVGILGGAAAVPVAANAELDLAYPGTAVGNYHHQGWNGYQNYPYAACASTGGQSIHHQYHGAHAAVPGPQAAMVLYPHVYSTVNQNQIHLHLHSGAERIDQYLGTSTTSAESGLTISSGRSGIEIEVGAATQQSGQTRTGDPVEGIMGDEVSGVVEVPSANDEMVDAEELHHQHNHHHHQHQLHQQREHEAAMGDPGSVWRPYHHG